MAPVAGELSLNRAVITRDADGTVVIDDPDYAFTVRVVVRPEGGRFQLRTLTVSARGPAARITAAVLGRLPVSQVTHLAGQVCAGGGHPNEALYRQLAQPRGRGQRGWPPEHWSRVAAVYRWAQETGRPGGGIRAIADLWGVTADPTAYRWMGQVRRLAAADALPPAPGLP